jgi:hypothetical protein
VFRQNLKSFYGAYGPLKIDKNGIQLRKLRPPKVEGVRNSKKQTTKHYKGQFLKPPKITLYVVLLLLKFLNDL